jgi:anti-sigma regulatory factor (Ser/Thr protein kinase)
MPDDAMATASYAVLDPESGALRIASAGHLPPIIVGKGTARVIDVPPSAPLGAFPYGSGTEVEATLVPGEILVLYTDGLIERPEVPLSESIKRLLEVIRDASSAEDACRLAVEELVPVAGLRDDVAIVALRNTEIPSRLSLRLVAKPRMLGHVRRNVRRWLRAHGANDQDTAEVVLAVSEACTNAIEHAYSPAPAEFEVEGVARDGEVTISIRDSGHWRTARGVHRGRGLAIIDAAMDDVSIRAGATGTEVLMRRGLRA